MILCLGLSPTLQRTLWFDAPVRHGHVHRAVRAMSTASGKAVNVARMVAQLGGESHVVHPLGGETGAWVARMLDGSGARQTIIDTPGRPTRICTTVLDGDTTELVEEAPPLRTEEIDALRLAVERLLPGAGLLCLSGSLPHGIPHDFLPHILERAADHGIDVLVDATKGPLTTALAFSPWLAKPNRAEGCATLGLPEDTDAESVAMALRSAGARNALITDGPATAVLATDEGVFRLPSFPVDAVNPIGSGDAVAAGIAYARSVAKMAWTDAGRFAIAAAAANCLTPTSGELDRETVDRLLDSSWTARP